MAESALNPEHLISLRKAFNDAIYAYAEKHKNLAVLTNDFAHIFNLSAFERKFGNRFFNMGNAEQNLVDTAAGLAVMGKIPFVCSLSIFLAGAAWEQIYNTVCRQNLNVKFVGADSGFQLFEEGAARQAFSDIALMRVIPNMKVFCPADSIETKQIVEAVINDRGPAYIKLFLASLPLIYDATYTFKIGKGSVLLEGEDIGLIAAGETVHSALSAAHLLQKDGFSVRLINMSSIKPLDKEKILETAEKVKMFVVLEDYQVEGGLWSAVAEVLAEAAPKKLLRTGMADLRRKYGLDAKGIYTQIAEYAKRFIG